MRRDWELLVVINRFLCGCIRLYKVVFLYVFSEVRVVTRIVVFLYMRIRSRG